MKIELTNPITHDGMEYGRGVHDLPDELARSFLKYDWAAREPAAAAGPAAGAVKEAPDAAAVRQERTGKK